MKLEALTAGMAVPFGGDQVATVSAALAAAFRPGDHLLVVQESGDLLHVPASERALAAEAVGRGVSAFAALRQVDDHAISAFFASCADRLQDSQVWTAIEAANGADVAAARHAGRAVTRLQVTAAMRRDMIAGLLAWRDAPATNGRVIDSIAHQGWTIDQIAAPLGVVGFVFEGRPNVLADAAGVLRSGNAAVFRIGSDALGTARAMMRHAVVPALADAGLPPGSLTLVESAAREAGWALFSDPRLALAVARGSGRAVAQLGSVARQAGVPVSLHGTGGAWMVAAADADAARFGAAVRHSLDRKVCNTLNVCCIVRARAADLLPLFLEAVWSAGMARGAGSRVHALGLEACDMPPAWRERRVGVSRAGRTAQEEFVTSLPADALGTEWEWDETPEVTLAIVESVDEAVALFNRASPRFVVSLISADEALQEKFFASVEAPFVGDGFTRWVDGQYALDQPELGLSNWEHGRLLARSAILAGSGVFTTRSRVRQADIGLHR